MTPTLEEAAKYARSFGTLKAAQVYPYTLNQIDDFITEQGEKELTDPEFWKSMLDNAIVDDVKARSIKKLITNLMNSKPKSEMAGFSVVGRQHNRTDTGHNAVTLYTVKFGDDYIVLTPFEYLMIAKGK